MGSIWTRVKLLPPHLRQLCEPLSASPNTRVCVYENSDGTTMQRDGVEPIDYRAHGCSIAAPVRGGAFGEIVTWEVTFTSPDAALAIVQGYGSKAIWLHLKGSLPKSESGTRRLSRFERQVLLVIAHVRGGKYRADALSDVAQAFAGGGRMIGRKAPWDTDAAIRELSFLGLVKVNKAGAVSLTDLGQQISQEHKGLEYNGRYEPPMGPLELMDYTYDTSLDTGHRGVLRDWAYERGEGQSAAIPSVMFDPKVA